MPGHDINVVGFSAGGVEALTQLVGGPPSELPAPDPIESGVQEEDRPNLAATEQR
ncbi:MAG TPA: hypothetical protein VNO19_05070 [Gemmatimonadales bacterium]|nr:hypothetical protein [Gemmatimonadales bacterium]